MTGGAGAGGGRRTRPDLRAHPDGSAWNAAVLVLGAVLALRGRNSTLLVIWAALLALTAIGVLVVLLAAGGLRGLLPAVVLQVPASILTVVLISRPESRSWIRDRGGSTF